MTEIMPCRKRLTKDEIMRLRELSKKAFCAPWRASSFEVEFDHDDGCPYVDEPVELCDVSAPEEYPDGQCVCQQNVIVAPGLEEFASNNAELISAMRNAIEPLLDELDDMAETIARLKKDNLHDNL